MKYLNKKFSVYMNFSQEAYDRIFKKKRKCPKCKEHLSLLGMKDKKTKKNQYYCKKCNRRVIL